MCRSVPESGRRSYRVEMGGHETIGRDFHSVLRRRIKKPLKISLAVAIVEEHILAAIAPLRQMVADPGHDNSCHSRHKFMGPAQCSMSREIG
jgi:hypothetical protein